MGWMFLFKKIVGPLLFPVSIVLFLLLFGFFLLVLTRRQKTGKIFILIGILLLGTLSYDGVSGRILKLLEYEYPPIHNTAEIRDIKWIVVLGGGYVFDPKVPMTSQLSDASIVRLVEGVRLHRELPGSKLIVSGGGYSNQKSNARALAEVAAAIGVKGKDLILEETSKDTEDQARLILEIVGRERFILVTSASHMPRSVAMFKRLGMDPIPAPTNHQVKESKGMTPGDFYPSARSLVKAENAFYEYLGLAWAKLRGVI